MPSSAGRGRELQAGCCSGDRTLPGHWPAICLGWPQRVTRLPSATQVAPRPQRTVNIIRQADGRAEASQADIGDAAQIPMLIPRETLRAPVPVKWLREVRTLQGSIANPSSAKRWPGEKF